MPARNNAASIGCSKRRNRETEPLGASASLEATDQKRSPYRPVSASREPVSGAIGSVTSGVRVCTGKSMMKHGETKQSQQSPLLTPGAPGANTDGHVTAFFNIDRLPSSPGDEKSSTGREKRGTASPHTAQRRTGRFADTVTATARKVESTMSRLDLWRRALWSSRG